MANSEEKAGCSATNQNYVSCIKIHGMRILPPLLNDAKRKHMQYYRELAVKAEQRIKWRKIKQQSFDSTDEGQSPTYFDSDSSSISDSIVCSSDDNTLKSQLTFSENCQDDVLRMLKDKEQTRIYSYAVKMPSLDSSAIANVPFLNVSDKVKSLLDLPLIDMKNKQMSTIDTSGNKSYIEPNRKNANYTTKNSHLNKSANENNKMNQTTMKTSIDNSIIIRNLTLPNSNITLRQQSYTVDNSDQVFTDDILKEMITKSNSPEKCCLSPENNCRIEHLNSVNNNNENSDIIDKSMNDSVNSEIDSSQITCTESNNTSTSLVRSNSYILEKPSPYLLAQIKRDQEIQTSGEHTRKQRRSWDFANARQKWSSIEHDINISKTSNTNLKTKPRRQVFNSLPSSAAPSPDKKMFNTSCDNLPKKLNLNKALKNGFFEKKNQQETPQKIKQYKRTIKPSPVSGRFVRHFVTPTRAPSNREAEKELSPKKVHLELKPKKLFTSCKTDLASREKVSQNKPTNSHKSGSKSVDTNYEVVENAISSKMKSTTISQGSKYAKSKSIETDYTSKNHSPPKQTDDVVDDVSENGTSLKIKPLKSKSLDTNNDVPDYISAPQDRIKEIIEKIQSDQSKKMAELISRQKQEQELLMKTFSDQQILLLSTLKETYRICSTPIDQNESVIKSNQSHFNESEILKNSENLVLECKQLLKNDGLSEQSSRALCYTSLSSPDDTLANLTLTSEQNENVSRNSNNHELSLNLGMNSPVYQVVTSTKYSRQFSEDSLETGLVTANSLYNGNSVITQIEKNVIVYNDRRRDSISCNKQLFPTQKQIWAATKINAAARGYLTRRLLKTERVQNLIQTIKDTLLCAMELHHETAENIQAADVELHRRLVQQVTAACFTFHDMFFDLSKDEQMSVIALDRERLREKMLRPLSARSSSSLTSTTQRVLQRKLRGASNDSVSGAHSRSSSSRSCHSASERKSRSKSIRASGNVKIT